MTVDAVERPSTGVDSRLHRNVGPCAPDFHMDLDRFVVASMAQTSIQSTLQAAQLETQLHISTFGAHCIEAVRNAAAILYRRLGLSHVRRLS